jgi:site-specific DNA recombinase
MLQENKTLRRVALYIRVSTAEQQIDGYGLEAQEGKLMDYVMNNKALMLTTKPEWIFRDTHTGSDLNRPAFLKLMDGVKQKKFDAVLVWKIDRLSRSLKHLLTVFEEFEGHNVSFISVQENIDFRGPIGRLIFQIFGAIAQFERELIKGRTFMGKMASAEMGNYTGTHIPFGYKPVTNESGRGKKLVLVPAEVEWVKKIYDWYIYENIGFGQIADRLNDLKVAKGKYATSGQLRKLDWTGRAVEKVLTSDMYRGEYVANCKDEMGNILPEADWTVVKIPAAVSEIAFQQAQLAREQHHGGFAEKNLYMLSGKLRDISFDPPRAFVGVKRRKGGMSYRRKQFEKNGKYHSVFEVPAKGLEAWVWNKIMEAMKEPEIFVREYMANQEKKLVRGELEEQLVHIREQKGMINLAIARAEQAYDHGTYSEEKLQEKLAQHNTTMTKLVENEQLIEQQLKLLASTDIEIKKLKEASERVKYRLNDLNYEQKRILCQLFVERIEISRFRVEKRWRTHADIFFRFNLGKLADKALEVRTQKEQAKANNKNKSGDDRPVGGRGGDRTHTPEGTRF